ncbi:MAG TPA: Crp/Fnr family transcriptional regulator [Anaerolineaceae bacterium]|nr:Crp/Fnr family transcriptional regulator [Anaerolineaceae bacterium]
MTTRQTTPTIDVQRLSSIPLFKDLDEAFLESVCAAAQTRRLQKDAFYFLQGDPADSLFVLIEGRVRLTQTNLDGQQVLLRVIGPYALFGAVALAQAENYPVTAEAAEASVALVWKKLEIMPFVVGNPHMAMNAIQVMATHAQEFQERFRQQATERVERRLAHTLLRLAAQTGEKTAKGVVIHLPLTRQELAEMSGTTLFTVSRILSQWEAQRLVIADREQIIIRYPHGLVNISLDLPFTPPE